MLLSLVFGNKKEKRKEFLSLVCKGREMERKILIFLLLYPYEVKKRNTN